MTVYLPDSSVPFKPMNPWGRPMPKPKRPVRDKPPERFQVHVERTSDGVTIPVGPKMDPDGAAQFCEAINRMIAAGREKSWNNAHVVRSTSL